MQKDFPDLFQFEKSAEAYLYSDSNFCLMKLGMIGITLGMIGITIINLMFIYDHFQIPIDNTTVKRIDALYYECLLTQGLIDILHVLKNMKQSYSRKLRIDI